MVPRKPVSDLLLDTNFWPLDLTYKTRVPGRMDVRKSALSPDPFKEVFIGFLVTSHVMAARWITVYILQEYDLRYVAMSPPPPSALLHPYFRTIMDLFL